MHFYDHLMNVVVAVLMVTIIVAISFPKSDMNSGVFCYNLRLARTADMMEEAYHLLCWHHNQMKIMGDHQYTDFAFLKISSTKL